jgi:hypothetical protein
MRPVRSVEAAGRLWRRPERVTGARAEPEARGTSGTSRATSGLFFEGVPRQSKVDRGDAMGKAISAPVGGVRAPGARRHARSTGRSCRSRQPFLSVEAAGPVVTPAGAGDGARAEPEARGTSGTSRATSGLSFEGVPRQSRSAAETRWERSSARRSAESPLPAPATRARAPAVPVGRGRRSWSIEAAGPVVAPAGAGDGSASGAGGARYLQYFAGDFGAVLRRGPAAVEVGRGDAMGKVLSAPVGGVRAPGARHHGRSTGRSCVEAAVPVGRAGRSCWSSRPFGSVEAAVPVGRDRRSCRSRQPVRSVEVRGRFHAGERLAFGPGSRYRHAP